MRIETGVVQGDEVSVFYDPMIAKLVVWEDDRDSAIKSLVYALDQYKVVGPNTNIQFLKDLLRHPGFIAGDVETGFIAKHKATLLKDPEPISPHAIAQAVVHQLLENVQYSKGTATGKDHPLSPLILAFLLEMLKLAVMFL